ncbi:MAG: hypothetical protein WDN04_09570 [Rhodospirillales bacterium]
MRSVAVRKIPTIRWPVRTWCSPNISVANTQPRSIDSSILGEKSEIEVAPRGSLSSDAVMSDASRATSIS